MPARSKRYFSAGSRPWLIIFSDLVTLLLTFFVVLMTISVISEKSRLDMLDSVRGVFGVAPAQVLLRTPQDEDAKESYDTGVVHPRRAAQGRGASSRPDNTQLLFADSPDVAVRYTDKAVLISFPDNLLFSDSGVELSRPGAALLDRLLPYLLHLLYPVTINGHSASSLGEGLRLGLNAAGTDPAWSLSLERALAVYMYLGARGVNRAMLKPEGHGALRPLYSNNTAEGRRKNRRVELALDKRNPGLLGVMDGLRPRPEHEQDYFFRDFRFNLDMPGASSPAGGGR